MNNKQKGFSLVAVLLVLVVMGVIGFSGWSVWQKSKHTSDSSRPASVTTNQPQSEDQPANLIKNIGFRLDYYNPATKRAGDVAFVDIPALKDPAYDNKIWMDYGAIDKRTSEGKRNPQPAFILPAGTKITAMTDGVITNVAELYSKDYAIHIASSSTSSWIFEHEHVVNPKVKVGDKVKAGDVIAEVGSMQNWEYGGNGIFEIGILRPGPKHDGTGGAAECPFKYLDPSVKDDLLAKVSAFYGAWEQYRGNQNIYAQETFDQPGCESSATMVW